VLARALNGEIGEWQRDRSEYGYDRKGDDELDEREAASEPDYPVCSHRVGCCTPPKGAIVPPGGGGAALPGCGAVPGGGGAVPGGGGAVPGAVGAVPGGVTGDGAVMGAGIGLDTPGDAEEAGGTVEEGGAPGEGGAGTRGCTGGGGTNGAAPTPGAPAEVSVPAANSSERASGRWIVRTRRGVIRRTISVFAAVSRVFEKRRPTTGSSPTPGTRSAVRRSSSLIRPASTWVSPSRSRNAVLALRVPI
jgi:hypothetical protein